MSLESRRTRRPAEGEPAAEPQGLTGGENVEVASGSVESADAPRFFAVMPGEIEKVPDGGDFVLDPNADAASPDAFEYEGQILRRVTPEEYAEINRITADAKLRREKGPRRLSTLAPEVASPAPAAEAAAQATPQPREEKRERRPRREREAPAQPELDEADMRRRAREQLERERAASEPGPQSEEERDAGEPAPQPEIETEPPARSIGTHEGLPGRIKEKFFRDFDQESFNDLLKKLDERNKERLDKGGEKTDVVPNVDESPESRRLAFREQLLRTLDPNGYQLHQNAEYTGREGELERYYTFAGLPRDMRFTQEEIEWVRGGFQGEPPFRRESPEQEHEPEPQPVPPEEVRRRPLVRRLVNETVVRGREQTPDQWNVRIEAFKGLNPKTVEQLIRDPKDNIGFSRLVESLDPSGIDIKRKTLAGERLTNEEMRLMNYARYEFTRRLQQVEYVNSKLNVQDLELFARRDPDLEALIGFRGSERTLEVFKREIYSLAMLNRGKFDELVHTYEKLSDLRTGDEYKHWEQGIRSLCKARGVELDDYEKAYRVDTPEERKATERAIRQEVRGNMSSFRRLIDTFDPISWASSKSVAQAKVASARGLNAMASARGGDIEQIDKALDTLTGMLRLTVVDNPTVSFAVQQEAVQGKNVPLSTESGPTTYKSAQEGIQPSTQEIERTLAEHARTYRTNYADRPGGDVRTWDFMSPGERRASLSGIESQYAKRIYDSGSGWFASALRAMWESLFRRKMDELINKPTVT